MKRSSIIIIGVIVLLGIWTFTAYNGLITKREEVNKTWSDVETQYERRADLIPNLVRTVKGYADFEQETLTQVIEARAKATQTTIDAGDLTQENMAEFQAAQGQLSTALGRLLLTVERYPDLKANQNFLDLQAQLEGTENRIQLARSRYNEAAKTYNVKIMRLPTKFIAMMFGFDEKPYFEASEGTDQAPEVSF